MLELIFISSGIGKWRKMMTSGEWFLWVASGMAASVTPHHQRHPADPGSSWKTTVNPAQLLWQCASAGGGEDDADSRSWGRSSEPGSSRHHHFEDYKWQVWTRQSRRAQQWHEGNSAAGLECFWFCVVSGICHWHWTAGVKGTASLLSGVHWCLLAGSLQCFDTAGWVMGRAFGLWKRVPLNS